MKKSERVRVNLTKGTIPDLKKPAKGYVIYWDETQPGFGLRVTAAGAKTYVAQGRIGAGTKERRIKIGRCDDALPPKTARDWAQIALGKMRSGLDPVAEKNRDKLAAMTLEEAFAEYTGHKTRQKDGKSLKLKPSTQRDMAVALRLAFGSWKNRPVTSITPEMVKERYKKLTATSTSAARADLSMRYLRAVINFAAESLRDEQGKKIITDNPVGVLKGRWKGFAPRDTVIKPEQLGGWVAAVEALPNRVASDLLMFLALTGCRRGEALTLRKDDVDLAANKLVFKDTKNRTDHLLPLTEKLAEVLARRIKESPTEMVFADANGSVGDFRGEIARVEAASGVAFSLHDLRRTAATEMERAGVLQYTLKATLNHIPSKTDVTSGYVRVDAAMKLAALEKLGAVILAKRRGVVVPMVRRGAR